jgi:hypothetical protein
MSSTRKTPTGRPRGRPRKPIPDAKVIAFPDNHRRDESPGAHLASWGPNHDCLPLHASNIVLIEIGKLICTFSLHIILQRVGFYLYDCKFVKWGQGERVLLPERAHTNSAGRRFFRDLVAFDKNATAKAFEQAALAAVRHAMAEFRERQAQAAPAAAPVDGIAGDDVPF